MKKWKYMSIYAPKQKAVDNEGLNDMGSKGWELIRVLDLGNRWEYVFKQPLEEETEKVEETENPRPKFLKDMPKNVTKYAMFADSETNGKFEKLSISALDYIDPGFQLQLAYNGFELIALGCSETDIKEGRKPHCEYMFMREKPADES